MMHIIQPPYFISGLPLLYALVGALVGLAAEKGALDAAAPATGPRLDSRSLSPSTSAS